MMMSTAQMMETITAAGWRVHLTEPRDDAHYWLAFAYRQDEKGKLANAKQTLSQDNGNMAMRLLMNALGFSVPPHEFTPPLKTVMLSLRFAIEENTKIRSVKR